MSVKTLATAPGPLKGYDSPLSDVVMCALIQIEVIVDMCFGL